MGSDKKIDHLSERGKIEEKEKMFCCQCVRYTIENGKRESYPKDWLTVIFLVSERKTELIFVMANIYVYIKNLVNQITNMF